MEMCCVFTFPLYPHCRRKARDLCYIGQNGSVIIITDYGGKGPWFVQLAVHTVWGF